MQPIQNVNEGFISVFGDRIEEPRDDQISIQFQYGVSSFDVTTSVISTGTIQSSNSLAVVASGTNTTSFAQIQTIDILPYQPGHESYCFFTAGFPGGSAANSTQWIGLFNTTDGVAVGYNNTTFSILYLNNSVSTIIPQSSFNGDTLNGSGPSGFTLNPANINVFRIVYGWLGAAPILFQIVDQNGTWITFHTIIRSNLTQGPSFSNPELQITSQVNKVGSTTANLSIVSASWNAGNEVSLDPSPSQRYFSANNSSNPTLNATGIETHILTIQNKPTFQGFTNKIHATITFFNGGGTSVNSLTSLIQLRSNATVTGLSFSNVNTANSIMQFSTAGTYVAGTGTLILIVPNNTFGSGPWNLLQFQGNLEIILYPGQSLTITGISLSGAGNTVTASIGWLEQF